MAATKVTATTPYVLRGTMRVVLLAAAPAGTDPIRSEINAGSDLADEITAMEGFTYTTNYAEWNVLGKQAQLKLSASSSLADSSMSFHRNKVGTGPHTSFTVGNTYYLCFLYGGDVTASKMDMWKVECSGNNPVPTFGDEPFVQKVDFGVISVSRDIAIPS